MKLFLGKRNQRSTAFVVLVLRTFAIASGAANACLLEAHDIHSQGQVMKVAKAASELDSRHEQADALLNIDHALADGFKASFQRFGSDKSKVAACARSIFWAL